MLWPASHEPPFRLNHWCREQRLQRAELWLKYAYSSPPMKRWMACPGKRHSTQDFSSISLSYLPFNEKRCFSLPIFPVLVPYQKEREKALAVRVGSLYGDAARFTIGAAESPRRRTPVRHHHLIVDEAQRGNSESLGPLRDRSSFCQEENKIYAAMQGNGYCFFRAGKPVKKFRLDAPVSRSFHRSPSPCSRKNNTIFDWNWKSKACGPSWLVFVDIREWIVSHARSPLPLPRLGASISFKKGDDPMRQNHRCWEMRLSFKKNSYGKREQGKGLVGSIGHERKIRFSSHGIHFFDDFNIFLSLRSSLVVSPT